MRVVVAVLLVISLCAVTHAMSFFPEEFSARLTVKQGKLEYAAAIYVRNTEKSGALWVKVQTNDKTKPVRTVYRSDTPGKFNLFKAMIGPKGELDMDRADCDKVGLEEIVDIESKSFVPRPIDEPVRLYKTTCPKCDGFWVFEVRNKNYILLTEGTSPKFILGSDKLIATVIAYAPGKSDDFKTDDVAAACESLAVKLKGTDKAKDKSQVPADQAKLFAKQKTLGKMVHQFPEYNDAVIAYMFGEATKFKMGLEDKVKREPKPDKPTGGDGRSPHGELVPPVAGFIETEVGKCDKNNIGDGKCDPECNTQGRAYDGGDCCEGTCKLYEYYVSRLAGNHPVKDHRQHMCGSQGFDCKTAKAVCGFLHGFLNPGHPPGTNAFAADQNPIWGNYWSDMSAEMEGICETVRYNNHETLNTGWNNTQLQLDYYTAAKSVHTDAARNRLGPLRPAVFAHSMANMLLTGACLDQGRCDVKWYDLAGPIRGSRAATNAIGVGTLTGMRKVADLVNWFVPGTISGILNAQDTLAPTFRDLALDMANPDRLSAVAGGDVGGLHTAATPLLLGAACGYKGMSSWTSPVAYGMSLLKAVVYGFDPSDGVVGSDECELYRKLVTGNPTLQQFGAFNQDDPLSPFFRFPGNHQSATGGLGEGDSARVLTYMRAMADGFPTHYIMYLRTRGIIPRG